jgi:hypothetical protein
MTACHRGVLGTCDSKPGQYITTNQQYVNPTMLWDCYCHVVQCRMVLGWSYHIFPSHHLNEYPAGLHGHLVSWDPAATANQVNISPLPNNMWIQPCRLISTIWLHNAVLLLNSNTTYFLHTIKISTLHDSMPWECPASLWQQTRSIYHN